MARLKTEVFTREMGERVLDAFFAWHHTTDERDDRDFDAFYEHGQWWITDRVTGRQWSVVDAEGGKSVDGFDFEVVSEGDDT